MLRLAASLRALRMARGLSLSELARRSRLSKSLLSYIEAGTAHPSLEAIWRLAEVLAVPLGTLIGEEVASAPYVLRAGEGSVVESQAGISGRMLLAEDRPHRTEVMEVFLEAQTDYVAMGHATGTKEFVICTQATITVGPLDREVPLNVGDAIWFPADIPHRYRSVQQAHALVIMSYSPVLGPPAGSPLFDEGTPSALSDE